MDLNGSKSKAGTWNEEWKECVFYYNKQQAIFILLYALKS